MVRLELAQRDVILTVLDFLQEQGLVGAMLALERETDVSLYKYS